MSSTIIWNFVLAIPFLIAFIAVPLWMSIRRPDRAPDHTAARRYLAVKGTPIISAAHPAAARPEDAGTAVREPVLSAR